MRFINDADATEQTFTLRGLARKPVAKKTLAYSCRVGETIERAVRVENIAKWKLVYRVQSDLPFLTGPEHCTVFSGASADYKFSLAPLYHGTFKGVLRFVATRDPFVYVHLTSHHIITYLITRTEVNTVHVIAITILVIR